MKLPMLVLLVFGLASCVNGAPAGSMSGLTAGSTPGAAVAPGELNNYGQATVPADGLIVFQGDELAYGADAKGKAPPENGASVRRSATPPVEALSRALGGVRLENRGFPGDTLAAGIKRWAGKPTGNLLILSYGYGDAGAGTPVKVYEETLAALVRSSRNAGAAVFLVTTPGIGQPGVNGAIDEYRKATRRVAAATGAPVFEAYQSVIKGGEHYSPTVYQRPAAYVAIAGAMVPYIRIAQPARP